MFPNTRGSSASIRFSISQSANPHRARAQNARRAILPAGERLIAGPRSGVAAHCRACRCSLPFHRSRARAQKAARRLVHKRGRESACGPVRMQYIYGRDVVSVYSGGARERGKWRVAAPLISPRPRPSYTPPLRAATRSSLYQIPAGRLAPARAAPTHRRKVGFPRFSTACVLWNWH